MAGEHVTEEQFGEFVKRMEQAFAHVHQRLDDQQQGFNQRLDNVENRMEQGFTGIHADIRQLRNWWVQLFGLVVFGLVFFGFIGGMTLMLFRELLFR